MDSSFLDRLIAREQDQSDSDVDVSPIVRSPAPPGVEPDERYPSAQLTLNPGGKQLKVMVADSPAARALGLSDLDGMGDYDGLLMSWPTDARAQLTNRNVHFPLAAAYFDSSGTYRDHQIMAAHQQQPIAARVAHRHVLEVHANDWDSLGIGPGSSISMDAEKDQNRNGTIQPL